MASPEDRFRARLREMEDSGMNAEELEKAAPGIAAQEFGPGPWDGPEYIAQGDDPLPHPRPTAPSPERKRGILSRVPGLAADAADFVRGGGNSFVQNTAGGFLGTLSPGEHLERASQKYKETARLAQMGMASPSLLYAAKNDLEDAQRGAKDSADHPIPGVMGAVAGGLHSPGSNVAARISSIPKATQGLAAVGKGMVSGGVGAGIDATIGGVTSGKNASEIGDEAGLATMVGGSLGGVFPVLKQGLQDPRGEIGRNLQALSRGQEFLKSPEAKALPKGMPGIGALASDEGERLGNLQVTKRGEALARAAKGNAEAPVGQFEPMDVSPIHRGMDRQVGTYSNEDVLVRKDVAGKVDEAKQALSRNFEPEEGYGLVPRDPKSGRLPIATPDDIKTHKQQIGEMAEHGLPATPENSPYRKMYNILAQATHSPDLPNGLGAHWERVDSRFAADMDKLAEGNELIFGKDNARAVTDSLTAGKRAAATMGQSLMDTRAGGAQLRVLEKIRNLGAEYAQAVDRVAAKIAQEGTTFGLPKVLSSPGKWAYQLPIQNVKATAVHGLEPLSRSARVPAAVGGAVAPLLRDPLDALLQQRENNKK